MENSSSSTESTSIFLLKKVKGKSMTMAVPMPRTVVCRASAMPVAIFSGSALVEPTAAKMVIRPVTVPTRPRRGEAPTKISR